MKRERSMTHLLLEVGNEVVPVLVLLQASERHLRARNVLQRGVIISVQKRTIII